MLGISRGEKVEVIGEVSGRDLGADWMAKVRVPARHDAPTLGALIVGLVAVVVGVLSAVAPPAGLPEWTLLVWMVGQVLVTLEAIWKNWFASLSFAQDDTTVVIICFDCRQVDG